MKSTTGYFERAAQDFRAASLYEIADHLDLILGSDVIEEGEDERHDELSRLFGNAASSLRTIADLIEP